jgi:3-hydroxyisobutyrate dehydrogenase
MADTRPAIGFIGIGLMGLPMSRRLLARGYAVTVYDVATEKLAPAIEAGAVAGAHPAEVAAKSDLVLLCVLDTAAVEAVVFGPNGVALSASADKLLVDHSTTAATATRELAARLKGETGMGWVDAPVSGGPPAAAEGQLTIMVGGEPEDVERASPVLADLGQRFTRMGPVGAGQATKMVNQVIVGSNFAVLAEALILAEKAGIDAAKLPECLAGGYADSALLQRLYPRMVRRAYTPPAGYARQLLKDLDMVHDLAKAVQAPTPMAAQATSLYRLLVARGLAEADAITVLKLYDKDPV